MVRFGARQLGMFWVLAIVWSFPFALLALGK
jgi:hypothetical protein